MFKDIKSKSRNSNQGILGTLLALGFFVLAFIALTSPICLIILSVWFVNHLID